MKGFLFRRIAIHLAATIIVIIFFLIIVGKIYTLNMAQLEKEYAARQSLVTSQSAGQLTSYFDNLRREFSLTARLANVSRIAAEKGMDGESLGRYYESISRAEIDAYFLTDLHGNIVRTSSAVVTGQISLPQTLVDELKGMHADDYLIQNVMIRNHGEPVSPQHFLFLMPFYSGVGVERQLHGIAGAVIDLDLIFKRFVSPLITSEGQSAWVMSQDGVILYLPTHPEMVQMSIFSATNDCLRCHEDFSVEQDILKNPDFSGAHKVGKHVMLVSASTSMLRGISFKVVTSVPLSSIANQARMSYLYMVLLSVTIILALSLSGAYAIRVNRKRAEALIQKLKASEEILYLKEFNENIIKNLPVGIVVIDKERKIQSINEEIIKQGKKIGLIRDIEGEIGTDVIEQIPESLRQNAIDIYNHVLNGGVPYFNPMITFRGKEEKLLLSVRINPLRDAKNSIVGAVIMREDITEQKRLEAEIKETKEYLEKIFEASVDGMIVTDATGVIRMANDAVSHILGYEKPELIGMHTSELSTKQVEHVEAQRRILDTLRKAGKSAPTEVMYRRKDGTFIAVEQSSSFVYDERGKIVAAVADLRDLTEKKKAESKQKELQQRLIQSEKLASIGRLAGGVAHEINNPLSGVVTNLGMIKEIKVPDPGEIVAKCKVISPDADCTQKMAAFYEEYLRLEKKRQRLLETAYKGGERCKKIIRDLLVFSRPSNGKEDEMVNVNECIEDSLEIVDHQLELNNVKIKKEMSWDLRSINGIKKEIEQVFLNIFINANHAMMPDGGELTIETKGEGNNVVVNISDTGCGIPEEVFDKIFDPFFTTKEVGVGTGLGLSIVYEIIEKHNGKIDVKSKAGEGTTFSFIFPAAQRLGESA
ncbi:MAG: PAS domain S-box protein [Candidatus Schekmanbacteria bacterium]|nr:PAS domain S-box protein [Candidatus Schekmanbacteria bacterium]